ncbi:MAG: hypothetical protein KJO50_04600, partial [Bacteroidia bacterium]|nr:hypothetical protein [Bacteroidia bacterium]
MGCKDESEAFIGLDRKAWTTDINDVSESYQINFDIPESQNFSCSILERIEVSINGYTDNNNIPSNCFLWLYTHALNCGDNTPISCPDILFEQQGLATQFEIDGEDVTEGTTIGIDIVVVIVVEDLSCEQEAISMGLYDASFEICLEAFYIPDEVEEPLDLGDDITICEGETIDLEGPDDFEIYEWEGPIDSDDQLLENAIPGLYFLEVTDSNGCRSSDDIVVNIIEMEEILFDQPLDLIFCKNNPVSVNILNYQGSQFDIEWSNQFGQSGDDSEIAPDTSGIYNVIITDTDNDCTITAELNVNIIETSNAQIAGDSIICEGGTTLLLADIPENDSIPYLIEWYVGQDTISTDTLVVSQADTIVLSLTDSLLCGTSLDTMVVMNSPEETAGLDNASTICINDSIDLLQLLNQASSENGYWVELSSGNELMSPQLVVSDIPGSYDYYYIIENPIPCSNDTAMFTITVSDIDVDAGQDMSSSYCQEDMIILENLISGDPGGFFTDDSGFQIMNTAFSASELNAGNNIFNYIIDTGNCGSDTAELVVTVYEEIPETVVDNILCQDETILVNNTTYDINNASGSEILFSVDGCDSLVVIDLEFHIDAQSNITDLLCTGDSIVVEGEVYNESNSTGTVIIPGGSEFGCDSTVIIDLSFADFIDTLISYQLCEDQTVTIENVLFDINNPSNTITLENGASNGCDSIINVDLTFVSAFNEEIQSELCPGEEISVNGSIYDINNPVGSEILTASNGCDSIVDIMLSFYMQGEMNLTVDLCDDETIMVGNDVYGALNLDGVSIIENGDINGCDSIINVFINYSQS